MAGGVRDKTVEVSDEQPNPSYSSDFRGLSADSRCQPQRLHTESGVCGQRMWLCGEGQLSVL